MSFGSGILFTWFMTLHFFLKFRTNEDLTKVAKQVREELEGKRDKCINKENTTMKMLEELSNEDKTTVVRIQHSKEPHKDLETKFQEVETAFKNSDQEMTRIHNAMKEFKTQLATKRQSQKLYEISILNRIRQSLQPPLENRIDAVVKGWRTFINKSGLTSYKKRECIERVNQIRLEVLAGVKKELLL